MTEWEPRVGDKVVAVLKSYRFSGTVCGILTGDYAGMVHIFARRQLTLIESDPKNNAASKRFEQPVVDPLIEDAIAGLKDNIKRWKS